MDEAANSDRRLNSNNKSANIYFSHLKANKNSFTFFNTTQGRSLNTKSIGEQMNRLNSPVNSTFTHSQSNAVHRFQRMSVFSSYSMHSKLPNLTISTENTYTNDGGQCHSSGSSPPPPALSPASSSPSRSPNNMINQPSSPSPPIIVAEIRGSSSASSASDKRDSNERTKLSVNASMSKTPCSNVPRISSEIIPSSSSSSSSTSSSSTLNDSNGSVNRATNGLPILEKISIALGSPRKPCGDGPVALKNDVPNANTQEETPVRRLIAEDPFLGRSMELSEPSVTIDRIDTSVVMPGSVNVSEPNKHQNKTRVIKRKTLVRSKRRSKARRSRMDSDSDFELNGFHPNTCSRGRSDAREVIRRVRQKVVNKRSGAAGGPSDPSTGVFNAETITQRRYLESPFLCLCQAGGTVSNILKTSTELNNTKCGVNTANLHANADNTIETDSNAIHSAFPAHLINPALRDASSQSNNFNGTHSFTNVPSTCPLSAALRGSESFKKDRLFDMSPEAKNIFSGLTYRPSGPLRTRDYQLPPEVNLKSPWLCAFCGEDSTYLGLGSLYGPYWITEVELKQFAPGCVYNPSETLKITEPDDRSCSSNTPILSRRVRSVEKAVRSGVITSTVTRSAAAQGRPTVANTGVLRLVIKASNSPATDASSGQETNPKPRIGPNGEVWFHLECVLWAPGTYINGNGTIGGLGEALQLALDVNCSCCEKRGAILSCCSRGCNLSYHYQCALKSGCHLDREQYTILCKKHHIYS